MRVGFFGHGEGRPKLHARRALREPVPYLFVTMDAALLSEHPAMARAAKWLLSIQNADGGRGEDGDSCKLEFKGYEAAPSTSSQTA